MASDLGLIFRHSELLEVLFFCFTITFNILNSWQKTLQILTKEVQLCLCWLSPGINFDDMYCYVSYSDCERMWWAKAQCVIQSFLSDPPKKRTLFHARQLFLLTWKTITITIQYVLFERIEEGFTFMRTNPTQTDSQNGYEFADLTTFVFLLHLTWTFLRSTIKIQFTYFLLQDNFFCGPFFCLPGCFWANIEQTFKTPCN